jgi:hypothetical protein
MMMMFSWTISQVNWLNSEKANISKTISVLILRVFEMVIFLPFNHLTWLIA